MDDKQFTEKCEAAIQALAEDIYGEDVPVLGVLIFSTPGHGREQPIDMVTFAKLPVGARDPEAMYGEMMGLASAYLPRPTTPIVVPLSQN